jgi:hypothetical protein
MSVPAPVRCTCKLGHTEVCTVITPAHLVVPMLLYVCTSCVHYILVYTVHIVSCMSVDAKVPVYCVCTSITVHIQVGAVYCTHFALRFLMIRWDALTRRTPQAARHTS